MARATPGRVLVTGVTGFVGGYLLDACRQHWPQAALYGLSHNVAGAGVVRAGDAVLLQADVRVAAQMQDALAQVQPDAIFHLAAQASVAQSWADPTGTLAINAGGAVHLFEALRAEGLAPVVVLAGSGEQYGLVRSEDNPIAEGCPFRPANPYAAAKACQDLYGFQYFAAYGLPIIRARAFNHFGPGQVHAYVIASFARQIALIEADQIEPVLRVGNLDARRDFLPVEDVVAAYIALAESGQPGEAYNIGSGRARSIGEVLAALLALARRPIEVQTDPERLRPVDVPLLVADARKLRADTGWAPAHDFDEALARTLEDWRRRVGTPAM